MRPEYWLNAGNPGRGKRLIDESFIDDAVKVKLQIAAQRARLLGLNAPVKLEAISDDDTRAGRFRLFNLHLVRTLEHLDLVWELQANGRTIQSGRLPLPATPPCEGLTRPSRLVCNILGGASAQHAAPILTVPFQKPAIEPGVEYFLHVRYEQNRDLPVVPRGHTVGWDQFRLPIAVPAAPPAPRVAVRTIVREQGRTLTVTAGKLELRFDTAAGVLTGFRSGKDELFVRGPQECFYRAPTDIDESQDGSDAFASRWQKAGLDRLTRRMEAWQVLPGTDSFRAVCDSVCTTPDGAEAFRTRTSYELCGASLLLAFDICCADNLPPLPRIGCELILAAGLEQVAWFGRGPFENYPDRKHAAMVGRYRTTVAEMLTPYVYPGECGARQDVRWCAFTQPDGSGLLIETSEPLFHFSALHVSWQDLAQAKYLHELPARPEVFVHLDTCHSGLGGDTGWTPNIHPEFQVKPDRRRFGFVLHPLAAGGQQ